MTELNNRVPEGDEPALPTSLRSVLNDEAHTLESWPDAVGRITAGVRRRRRRRAVVSVTAGVLIAAAIATPTLLLQSHTGGGGPRATASGSPSVIPWLDDPAPVPTILPSFRPTARPCGVADLPSDATVSDHNAGISQEDAVILAIHNVGSSRCTLFGRVSVTAGGLPIDTRPDQIGLGNFGEVPATIDPGETANVRIARTMVCNGGVGSSTVGNIALTYAGKSIGVPGLSLSGSCAYAYATEWFRQLPEPPAVNPYRGLQANVETFTRSDGRLGYRVVLSNPTKSAIIFNPCPVYADGSGSTYRLNCAAIGNRLAPGRSAVFAMNVSTPMNGVVKFDFRLFAPDGTEAVGAGVVS
jgi:hypothetical protein